MPARKLTPAEENAASAALAKLVKAKLEKKPGRQGRPSGLQPLHAALMIREGRYDVAGGSKLSDDAKLTAAATAYGVNRDAIKDKLDKLAQCDAPKPGAAALQTPAAARERLLSDLEFECEDDDGVEEEPAWMEMEGIAHIRRYSESTSIFHDIASDDEE